MHRTVCGRIFYAINENGGIYRSRLHNLSGNITRIYDANLSEILLAYDSGICYSNLVCRYVPADRGTVPQAHNIHVRLRPDRAVPRHEVPGAAARKKNQMEEET